MVRISGWKLIEELNETSTMLRIEKIKTDKRSVTLKLDGKIEGIYLDELEGICTCLLAEGGKTVTLDFSGVSFIDDESVAMLTKMKDGKLKIINCSPFIRTLLNDPGMKKNPSMEIKP